MKPFSVKEHLSLNMPTEDLPLSDEKRILLSLEELGYPAVSLPLHVLQQLYPLCRDAAFDITVTLVHREQDWVVTAVEPGDTRQHHYGLAVDYGSTTIIMRLVDLNSGAIVGEESCVNGQVVYGTDILTRITWSLEDSTHADRLQAATAETFSLLLEQLTRETGIDAAKCPRKSPGRR